ncbi:MAG: hypothetical protein IJV43_00470 [Oscillospiraceae bacterium]|nr:hypothetical protein [Oscillospiraceae bacterium]
MSGGEPEKTGTYQELMSDLWSQAKNDPDPRTLSRLVAAESCWMQVPDAEVSTAAPDMGEIDGWARKIEGTKAFGRMLDSPKLQERIASRDAEGMMTDLHGELTARARDKPVERERERTAEKQQRKEQRAPEHKAPEGPTR